MHLTERAHGIVAQYLNSGDLAIDATAGNGHDSCFLARQVGDKGRVFAFDIQQQALKNTEKQLEEKALQKQVALIQRGHEYLAQELPADCHGKIQAIMFNLGYLPGGDKQLTTTSTTTLAALDQARPLLACSGVITVLAYRGHPGGQEETLAVEHKLQELATAGLEFSSIESPGPVLFILAPHPHG